MHILFLTIGSLGSIEDCGIYPDLLRCFRDHGHIVYTVSPYEKRMGLVTELKEDHGVQMLHVKIGNIIKCGIIEKGISTLQIESRFISAIKKYFKDIRFDLVLYSTPPITFEKVVRYIKKRDNAKSYLLLKDIFPQNAVDIGLLSTSGVKSIIYKYFRNKEKRLYANSDRIGCMSQANVDYLLEHNPEIDADKVEICPNSIDVRDLRLPDNERKKLRKKYGIPQDKTAYLYGGNLGKPQDIPFIIECIKSQSQNTQVFFVIAGGGTEYGKLEKYYNQSKQDNLLLLQRLSKDEFDRMAGACDVGLIFLDHRFTIPNFPSRLLSYMQAGLPVLACTDSNTDIGTVITEGGFGWWCESNNIENFKNAVDISLSSDLRAMGDKSYRYLINHYSAEKAYTIIMRNLM